MPQFIVTGELRGDPLFVSQVGHTLKFLPERKKALVITDHVQALTIAELMRKTNNVSEVKIESVPE